MKRRMACLTVSALLIAADQILKLWVVSRKDQWFADGGPEILGLINLTYTTNTGAAGGILPNALWLLIPLPLIASAAMVWAIMKNYFGAWQADWALALILAGAVGNVADRIRLKEVIDYLQFSFWKSFPIFNLADTCVVCGGIFLALYMLYSWKKEAKTAEEAFDALDGDGSV